MTDTNRGHIQPSQPSRITLLSLYRLAVGPPQLCRLSCG